MQQSGRASYARGVSFYTIFAPIDAAFNKVHGGRAALLATASMAFPDTARLAAVV
ncbi:MAG: hypothetical protein JOY71_28895 [Acetobacteraceae bacterium]|nr:hypothetical protein [Acetobacteraceae bacterium]MBV8526082.1 hypothetical protein [Acetobacteraceae bacterium]